MKKGALLTCLALLCTAVISGCGGSYASMDAVAPTMSKSAGVDAVNESLDEVRDMSTTTTVANNESSESAQSTNRKLIRTVYMQVETEKYDELLPNIDNKVKEYGGYIENSSSRNNADENRTAEITARIPANKLDEFLANVSGQTNVTYKTENTQDVTLSYVDLQSHKKALEEEQESLMRLLEQAETLEDIMTIESRLTDVRYQLESMESQLRTYDNQVDYSTVTLEITEVQVYTPTEETSTQDKISQGFKERADAVVAGFKNFGIWFVIHIPDLLVVVMIIAIILFIIWLCIKLSNRHVKKVAAKRVNIAPAVNTPQPPATPQAVNNAGKAKVENKVEPDPKEEKQDANDSGKDSQNH